MLIVREVRAKSILNTSKIYDYCLNPYTGCQVGCRYCYARLFIPRYSGHSEPWGEFVDVKVNAPDLLRKQLLRAKRGTVWVSSVCDPYQPLEAEYQLTRRCLEELLAHQFPVCIQTKSALVLRDLDLIRQFREVEVGFTIATDDEGMARLFEPEASPLRERAAALAEFRQQGVKTFAFLGPLLPGSADRLAELVAGKVDYAYIDRMNYSPHVRAFYAAHGLAEYLEEGFFLAQARKLEAALRRHRVSFKPVY